MLADDRWALALRGLFAILFGLVGFNRPVAAILALALMFVAYSVADGRFNIISALHDARGPERWLLGIAVGLQGGHGRWLLISNA